MDVHFTTKVHKQNQFVDYQCPYYGDHDQLLCRGHHSMDTDSLQTDSICGILLWTDFVVSYEGFEQKRVVPVAP